MRANPKPQNGIVGIHAKGAIVGSNSNRPNPLDLLKVQGGMKWIVFEQFKILVSELLDGLWEVSIMTPKAR